MWIVYILTSTALFVGLNRYAYAVVQLISVIILNHSVAEGDWWVGEEGGSGSHSCVSCSSRIQCLQNIFTNICA